MTPKRIEFGESDPGSYDTRFQPGDPATPAFLYVDELVALADLESMPNHGVRKLFVGEDFLANIGVQFNYRTTPLAHQHEHFCNTCDMAEFDAGALYDENELAERLSLSYNLLASTSLADLRALARDGTPLEFSLVTYE